jgi:hypothetical protein
MTPRIVEMMVMLGLTAGAAPARTARTAPMMRDKLVHTQRVLEALTTSNFELLARESSALSVIAASPRWAEDAGAEAVDGYLPESGRRSLGGIEAAGLGCSREQRHPAGDELLPVPQAPEAFAHRRPAAACTMMPNGGLARVV